MIDRSRTTIVKMVCDFSWSVLVNVLIAPSSSSSQWGIQYFKRTYSVLSGRVLEQECSVAEVKTYHNNLLYEKDIKGIRRIVIGAMIIVD